MKIKTRSLSAQRRAWVRPRVLKVITRRPDLARIRRRLLALGGEEVQIWAQAYGPEEAELLWQYGQLWSPKKLEYRLGAPCHCFDNSQLLADEGCGDLIYGFGLSRDGLWRPHAWVWLEDRILETTAKRLIYYGFNFTQLVRKGLFHS